MLQEIRDQTEESYEQVLEKNLQSIEKVPVVIADDRILKSFKIMQGSRM